MEGKSRLHYFRVRIFSFNVFVVGLLFLEGVEYYQFLAPRRGREIRGESGDMMAFP